MLINLCWNLQDSQMVKKHWTTFHLQAKCKKFLKNAETRKNLKTQILKKARRFLLL